MTAKEMFDIYHDAIFGDMKMTSREKHIAATAFWSGIVAGLHPDISTDGHARLRDEARKHSVATLACIIKADKAEVE